MYIKSAYCHVSWVSLLSLTLTFSIDFLFRILEATTINPWSNISIKKTYMVHTWIKNQLKCQKEQKLVQTSTQTCKLFWKVIRKEKVYYFGFLKKLLENGTKYWSYWCEWCWVSNLHLMQWLCNVFISLNLKNANL